MKAADDELAAGGGQNPAGVDNDFVNLFFVDILEPFHVECSGRQFRLVKLL